MTLSDIGRILLFVSSQRGVGKSSVVNHLAHCLLRKGLQVGILDFFSQGRDILSFCAPAPADDKESPPALLSVVSESDLKTDCMNSPAALENFLARTHPDALDYLMVDTPSGPDAAVAALIRNMPHAEVILVTAPNKVSHLQVRQMIRFFRDEALPIHGWIENMCGYLCQNSLQRTGLFMTGSGSRAVFLMDFPFLGRIPYSPMVSICEAVGKAAWETFTDSEIADALDLVSSNIAGPIRKPDPVAGKEP